MAGMRKKHTVQTKVKVVLEALKGEQTTSQLTAKYGVHATQISSGKAPGVGSVTGDFSGSTAPASGRSASAGS